MNLIGMAKLNHRCGAETLSETSSYLLMEILRIRKYDYKTVMSLTRNFFIIFCLSFPSAHRLS